MNRQQAVLTLLAVTVVCTTGFGQAPAVGKPIQAKPAGAALEPTHVVDLKTASPAELRIRSELTQPTTIDFIDTPLTDGIHYLADAHKIAILLDTKALLENGIGTDEPLNQQLKGVNLKSAFKILLQPLGLTTVVEDEVLKVTTIKVANSILNTHVYDIRALRQHGIESEALVELIPKVVSPTSWSDTTGSIKALPGSLVIRQNAQVHGEVQELFEQLTRLGKPGSPAHSK